MCYFDISLKYRHVRLKLAWLKDNFCCWFQTKPAAAAGKAAPKSAPKKQPLKGKGLKKKKVSLKFVIDCTHPVEDSILDVANFVSSYLISYYLMQFQLHTMISLVECGVLHC